MSNSSAIESRTAAALAATVPPRVEASPGSVPFRPVADDRPAALSITDEGLLERIRSGDPTAGDALVGRYAEPLLRYLRRLVGDDLAEELHQQTWLSVLDNLHRFDPQAVGAGGTAASPFKAWLFRIATNKANDLWRSRGRERAAKEGLRLTAESTAPWAGAKAVGEESAGRLLPAIEQLPPSQTQVHARRD